MVTHIYHCIPLWVFNVRWGVIGEQEQEKSAGDRVSIMHVTSCRCDSSERQNPKSSSRLRFTQSRTSHRARRHELDFKNTYSPYRPIGRLFDWARRGGNEKKKTLDPKRVCKPITWRANSRWGKPDLLRWGVRPRREHLSIQFPLICPLLLPPPGACALTKYNDSPKTTPCPHLPRSNIFSAING